MTDDELKAMLRAWEAPPAPATLKHRVFPRREQAFWRWLLSGEIRVPVPVALALACVLLFIAYGALRPPAVTLSDFEHVQRLQPRIVRTIHETP
ncbi:MAG TPA: hypothetical protein VES20_24010 [Bryobacteraceae bacterium]|nr:hypothetical protein [Bryobacteraceae bacterium]